MSDDEVTPTDKRTPFEAILDEVIATRAASERTADVALQLSEQFRTVVAVQERHSKDIAMLKATGYWLPTVFSVTAIFLAVLALTR